MIRLLIVLFLIVGIPSNTMAISNEDRRSVIFDTVFYEDSVSCVVGAGTDTLDGHKLPATKGGVGLEEYFSDPNVYALVPPPASQDEIDYYITMRWRYAKWAWDGTTVSGPEDLGFYQKHPRILVTNPANGKSIIAVAIEAGPAPWTGTAEGKSNKPAYWQGHIDGTPKQYTGRVAGLPPKAFAALGAKQRMYGKVSNDDLLYSWAPDQSAKPGPTNQSASVNIADSSCIGGVGVNSDGFAFPLISTQASIKNKGWCWQSTVNCHHDYNAADIFEDVGTPVVAPRDGVVVAADNDTCNGTPNAPSVRIYNKDLNEWYYMNHMRQGSVRVHTGQKVKAGEVVGVIGPSICAQGTPPHIHIDLAKEDNSFSRPGPEDGKLVNIQPVLIETFTFLPER